MSFLKPLKYSLFSFLAGRVAPPLLKIIRLSCRLEARHREHFVKLSEQQNFIIAFWHGQILPLAQYFLNSGYYTFVSPHRDGEYVARMMTGMGQNHLRTSIRDPRIGELRRAFKLAARGENLGVTPDGPLGPRFSFQPGVVAISRRTKLPILPVAGLATRAYYFSSWDRFCFPLPLGRTIVSFGQPFRPWQAPGSLEQQRQKIETTMLNLTRELADTCSVPADYFEPAGVKE